MNESHFRDKVFAMTLRQLFIVKEERFFLSRTIFLGKNSNFFVTAS